MKKTDMLVKKALKNNVFLIGCLLFFLIVFVMGSISYSKYIIDSSDSADSNVGSFSVSTSIDGISGLSFTNTDFWSSSDENDQIAMNVLRNLNFSVNNFKVDSSGNKIVSDVKLQYNLSFSTPAIFAKSLAIQLFNNKKNAILPQIVINDLISTEDNKVFKTADSIDYGGSSVTDLEFTVKKTTSLYTAKSDDVIITISEYEDYVDQSLIYRMWDSSQLTNENNPVLETSGGQILPPLEVNFKEKVKFFQVTIIMDSFILPAGSEQTDNYVIKLVPTSVINDKDLGSTIVEGVKDSANNIVAYENIKQIYGGVNGSYFLKSLLESSLETYYDNPSYTGNVLYSNQIGDEVVTGNVNLYKDGTSVKSINTKNSEVVSQNESIITKEATETDGNWNSYVIKSDEPQLGNYQSGAIATGVDASLNKIYYIHKLDVERTKINKLVIVTKEYEITPVNNVTKQTEVIEESTINRLDGENEIITQNVVRKTSTTYVGNFKCITTITTTTYEREYTQKGFIYRAYYVDSNNQLKYLDNIDYLDEAIIDNGNVIVKNNDYYLERINVTEESYKNVSESKNTKNETEVSLTNIIVTNYDYFQRKITRSYDYKEINIDRVVWSQLNDEDIMESVEINSDNILYFFDDDVQKKYLDSAYSKNYPFYVNVIFEQVQ